MLKPEIKNTQNSYQCVTTYCMAYIRETNKQIVLIQLALLLKNISLNSIKSFTGRMLSELMNWLFHHFDVFAKKKENRRKERKKIERMKENRKNERK